MSEEKIVWKGPDKLRPLLVPLATLRPDPDNENKHTPEQIKRMTISLAEHGQPDVATLVPDFVERPDGKEGEPLPDEIQHWIVNSGNLRLAAAEILSWTHLAAVPYGEDPAKAPAYRIAANKIPQMSKLDPEAVLKTSQRLRATVDKFDPGWIGFTDEELKKAQEKLDKDARSVPKPPAKADDLPPDKAGEPGHKSVDVHVDGEIPSPIPDTATIVDFPTITDRNNFVSFLRELKEYFPEAETAGDRILQYLAKAGGEPEEGFYESKFFTFKFGSPDEFNRFSKFLAQLNAMYAGGDDLKRFFLFLDETTE